jgi:ketosteroid isomerase-like protein
MTDEEKSTTRDRIETALKAFENRDAVAAAGVYAEDGFFVNPHYPELEYRGREAIQEALE